VVTPLTRSRKVYLPAGQDWVDFYSHKLYKGGQTIRAAAPLSHIPLFIRAGDMIPLGEVVPPQFHAKDDVRQILVFPTAGAGKGSLVLHEDDGVSLDYQRGEVTRLAISADYSTSELNFSVKIEPYGFALPYNELEFILPRGEKRNVKLEGIQKQWQDQNGQTHFTWPVPDRKA